MENLLFLGVPILKHFTVITVITILNNKTDWFEETSADLDEIAPTRAVGSRPTLFTHLSASFEYSIYWAIRNGFPLSRMIPDM